MLELIYPVGNPPFQPAANIDVPAPEAHCFYELIPIVDISGAVIAQTTREYAHGGSKVLHPVIHLHVIDRKERIYLQKRAMNKFICPGMWDTAVGGHVIYGEYLEEALLREASEEIGLTDFNPVFLDSYIFESSVEKELISVFATIGDFQFTFNDAEVDEGRYWPVEEVAENIGNGVFTPNFELEFGRYKEKLLSLL